MSYRANANALQWAGVKRFVGILRDAIECGFVDYKVRSIDGATVDCAWCGVYAACAIDAERIAGRNWTEPNANRAVRSDILSDPEERAWQVRPMGRVADPMNWFPRFERGTFVGWIRISQDQPPGLPHYNEHGEIKSFSPCRDPQNWDPVFLNGRFWGYRMVRGASSTACARAVDMLLNLSLRPLAKLVNRLIRFIVNPGLRT